MSSRRSGALAVLAAGLLAGCSSSPPARDGAITPATTAPTPPRVTSTSTINGTRAAGVSISTDRTVYRVGEVIHVVIGNAGDRDVYAASGASFCTVVTVERSSGDSWRPVAPCEQGAPPGLVRIAGESSLSLDLPPPGISERLGAGTYRLRCAFALGAPGGSSAEARSPVFLIRA